MERKAYKTEEERIAARRERQRRWRMNHPEYDSNRYQKNKEYFSKYHENWRKENKEELSKRRAEYESTPEARALHLARNYKTHDLKANRGECTITGEWIIKNIFTSPCRYCGESDCKRIARYVTEQGGNPQSEQFDDMIDLGRISVDVSKPFFEWFNAEIKGNRKMLKKFNGEINKHLKGCSVK